MRNPFRRSRPQQQEKRDIGVGDVSWPTDSLMFPDAISVDRALRLAPVFAAGRLLASSVASLPLQVYRRRNDERERIPTPSLFEQPSPVGTLHDWLWRLMTSLVYRGNAVGLVIERDWMEFPREIEWLDPSDVTVQDQLPLPGEPGSFLDPIWYWRGERIPQADIVHIPWMTLPGRVWGLSPLTAFALGVSTALSAQKFSDDWFKAGGVPPGKFKNSAETVDQKQATIIKQRLLQAIRTREPIVYGKDWEFEPITISPNEAKFVETMQLTATQVANVYGIPPELLGGETGDSYTYSSPEQRQIEFIQVALMPWLTKLESHFAKLLPRGQYVKFNVDALIRTDTKTRYETYQIARNIGIMSVDEIRVLEDMPPLPNGEGGNYTPLPLQAKGLEPLTTRSDDSEAGKAIAWAEDQTERINNLEKYWKFGEGAGKIRWGTHGDTTRCHRHLQKHVGSERAWRICAQWSHDMTGYWPGSHLNP